MNTIRLIQEGPRRTGGVMVVGEAPGSDEDRLGRPFVGVSGHELDTWLGLAGFNRSDLFLTNVCHERPPANEIEAFFCKKSLAKREGVSELHGRYPHRPVVAGLQQLQVEVDRLQPSLIICLGSTALWAFTGETGIIKWRGSILPASGGPVDAHGAKLIPTLHPAAVLREYVWRAVCIQDLRRAKRESAFPEIRRPQWNFTVPKTVDEVEAWFEEHVWSQPADKPLVADVENFYETDRLHSGRLICLGVASDHNTAMCIPFVHRGIGEEPSYWPADDEVRITHLCRSALQNRPIVFHNRLHDCQILARNWGVMPQNGGDTMVMQHVAFPGQLGGKIDPITGKVSKKGSSLSLGFCSSMYCNYHRWWKDDGKGWDPSIHDEDSYWRYNCEDVVRTYEVMEELEVILRRDKLYEQYLFELSLFAPVFDMMFRGMNFDEERRREMLREVNIEAKNAQAWINLALDHPLNVGSMVQMRQLFYGDFGLPPILHRKTKQPTLDDKALDTIAKRKPLLVPLIERIQYLRSLGVFKENFLEARTSTADKRLRASQNIVGPETYRFSSNITAFGEGTNLQNLPRDPS
jgi:uracil-DNA glycosylase